MDDLYPNDGSYFDVHAEPEEQVAARRESLSKAQAAKPVIEDLIKRKKADIDRMGRTDAIHVDPEVDTDSFMKAWYGVQEVKAYAQAELEYLESLLQTTR